MDCNDGLSMYSLPMVPTLEQSIFKPELSMSNSVYTGRPHTVLPVTTFTFARKIVSSTLRTLDLSRSLGLNYMTFLCRVETLNVTQIYYGSCRTV